MHEFSGSVEIYSINQILSESKNNKGWQSRLFIIMFRVSQKMRGVFLLSIITKIFYILYTFLLRVDIPLSVRIGYGLQVYHPFCIAIHPSVSIGSNCLLRHGVTIGNRGDAGDEVPTIEDNVEFGCYALVFGGVTVPRSSRLKAMSIFRSPRGP